jgi:hypothetical protein
MNEPRDPMGFQRVLDELNKKYQEHEPVAEKPDTNQDPLGVQRAMAEFVKNQRTKIERIEQFPSQNPTFKKEDLAAAFEARGRAGYYFQQQPPEKWPEALQRVEQFLDSLPIWSAKFSTMPGSGSNDKLETSSRDSTYYITPAGNSLRLRRMSLDDGAGPEHVVEPVFEQIYFTAVEDDTLTQKPELGYWVKEVSSTKFIEAQKSFNQTREIQADYKSPLKIHRDQDRLVGILSGDGTKLAEHTGDRINKIYFNR